MSTVDFLLDCPDNPVIRQAVLTMRNRLDFDGLATVSVSGGADSDLVVDMLSRSDHRCDLKYIFFDTGLEYQATKDHLTFLQQRYGIQIERIRAVEPIPVACRNHGIPIFNKREAEYIGRLQRHGFDFTDDTLENDLVKYPNVQMGLYWWHNAQQTDMFNIRKRKYLREYMIQHPPQFSISADCCKWAKKKTAHLAEKMYHADLSITGLRKAEGGDRAVKYKTCYSVKTSTSPASYRPLFWFSNQDKECYEKAFNVRHSRCYTEYGLKRTGCAGCPFGRDFEYELKVIQEHEPKLYQAVCHVFGPSYEYYRQYYQFRKDKQKENKE